MGECRVCKYVWNVLIAIDQLCNAILAGDPDETMSSRFGKWSNVTKESDSWKRHIAKVMCYLLNLIDKNHCPNSIEADEGKNDLLGD